MRRLALAAAVAFLAAGCATRYAVTTNGFLDRSAGDIVPGSSFAVVGNAGAQNPIFDEEVGEKISRMLSLKGFRSVPPENADYVVRYGYDVSGRAETTVRPEFVHGAPVVHSVYVSGQRYTAVSSFDYITHVRETDMVYTSRLFLRVLDGARFREKEEKAVWIGDTLSESENRDLREVVDYLMAATFRKFGENTGRNVQVNVAPADADVAALRGQAAAPRAG